MAPVSIWAPSGPVIRLARSRTKTRRMDREKQIVIATPLPRFWGDYILQVPRGGRAGKIKLRNRAHCAPVGHHASENTWQVSPGGAFASMLMPRSLAVCT